MYLAEDWKWQKKKKKNPTTRNKNKIKRLKIEIKKNTASMTWAVLKNPTYVQVDSQKD